MTAIWLPLTFLESQPKNRVATISHIFWVQLKCRPITILKQSPRAHVTQPHGEAFQSARITHPRRPGPRLERQWAASGPG